MVYFNESNIEKQPEAMMAYPPPNPAYPPPLYPAPPVAGQHQPTTDSRGVPLQYPGYPSAGYTHQPPPPLPPPGVGLYQPPAALPQVKIPQCSGRAL